MLCMDQYHLESLEPPLRQREPILAARYELSNLDTLYRYIVFPHTVHELSPSSSHQTEPRANQLSRWRFL